MKKQTTTTNNTSDWWAELYECHRGQKKPIALASNLYVKEQKTYEYHQDLKEPIVTIKKTSDWADDLYECHQDPKKQVVTTNEISDIVAIISLVVVCLLLWVFRWPIFWFIYSTVKLIVLIAGFILACFGAFGIGMVCYFVTCVQVRLAIYNKILK